jgi:hypothetical protein
VCLQRVVLGGYWCHVAQPRYFGIALRSIQRRAASELGNDFYPVVVVVFDWIYGKLVVWNVGLCGGIYKGTMVRQMQCQASALTFELTLLLVAPQIAHRIIWPCATAGMLLIAFAQSFFTLLQLECSDPVEQSYACSIRDAYRVVYMLARGESLIDPLGRDHLTTETAMLVAVFLAILAMFTLALLVAIILATSKLDFDHIAVTSYWEKKLALALCAQDFGITSETNGNASMKNFETSKSQWWDYLTTTLQGDEPAKGSSWFLRPLPCRILQWIPALIILPIWIICGVLTAGVLWPPQVRIWLFRPTQAVDQEGDELHAMGDEQSRSNLADIRNELTQMKIMSFEKSAQVESAVHELKALLLTLAMQE